MALTAQEITDITASTDGVNKIAELNRMDVSNLDNRFLAVNEPGSAAEKAQIRADNISRIINYVSADFIRADINVLGFDGTNLILSSDNDYTALEQTAIEAYAVRLDDTHTGFSRPKHAVAGLSFGNIFSESAYAEISNNTPGPQQTGISNIYVKINQFDTVGLQKNITVSGANSNLTVLKTGFYTIYYSLSFTGSANETYITAIHHTDTEIVKSATVIKLGTGGDVGNCSSQCILQIDANDIIDIRVRTNVAGSNNFTLQTANFIINRVR